jgi:hypothetical protein
LSATGAEILFCEELADVGEGIEFEGVTGGVEIVNGKGNWKG